MTTHQDAVDMAVYVVISVGDDDIASVWDSRAAARAEAARLSGEHTQYTVDRFTLNRADA